MRTCTRRFSERFPGITLKEERIYVDRRKDLDGALEPLYLAYLDGDLNYGAISAEYAAGLDILRQGLVPFVRQPLAIKGQVTGPISWGLTIVDHNQRPILYDDVLADAVGQVCCGSGRSWQERELRKILAADDPLFG